MDEVVDAGLHARDLDALALEVGLVQVHVPGTQALLHGERGRLSAAAVVRGEELVRHAEAGLVRRSYQLPVGGPEQLVAVEALVVPVRVVDRVLVVEPADVAPDGLAAIGAAHRLVHDHRCRGTRAPSPHDHGSHALAALWPVCDPGGEPQVVARAGQRRDAHLGRRQLIEIGQNRRREPRPAPERRARTSRRRAPSGVSRALSLLVPFAHPIREALSSRPCRMELYPSGRRPTPERQRTVRRWSDPGLDSAARADVAQLVERRLPKPKVAGSTPVVRFAQIPLQNAPFDAGGRP